MHTSCVVLPRICQFKRLRHFYDIRVPESQTHPESVFPLSGFLLLDPGTVISTEQGLFPRKVQTFDSQGVSAPYAEQGSEDMVTKSAP